MCIVADSVKDVSKTKIASFHTGYTLDGGATIIPSQLIVYSATVDSNTNTNAFILPVYNPGNEPRTIIPLDFSKLPDFFASVDNIFDRWFPKPMYLGSMNYSTNSFDGERGTLEVHRVGDYKFSIMPSKIDFNRINRNELNISPAAKSAIDMHSNDYSFIVYQFYQRGQIEITPFAYLCTPLRENAMIIPTIHGHPHDNVPDVGLGYVKNMYVSHMSPADFEQRAEFDHEIYGLVKNIPNVDPNSKSDIVAVDKLLRSITTDYMNRKIRVYAPKSFVPKKIKLSGYKDNRNMLIKLDGHSFIQDLVIDGIAMTVKN